MAHTARSEADCKEFFDDEVVLKAKIKKLAALIRNSKHFCSFTGAGISTAAGIADFRSGINTVLDTGTGAWAAKSARQQGKSKQIKKNKRSTRSIKAIPTASHMALVSLMTTGPKYLKCMISQNTDGLHRRSGIPVDQLCELHGNTTLEVCNKCDRGYMRDYRCRNSLRAQKVHDHKTGRYCTVPKCGGKLCDTIINFQEPLADRTVEKAQINTDQCDVMLALGSSLTVTPAADFPAEVGDRWAAEIELGIKKPKNHLVIVNLQKTPLDHWCSLRIFAKIDDVMVPLMKELGLQIPEWKLQRFLKVTVRPHRTQKDMKSLVVSAVDVDGITATVFEGVKLSANGQEIKQTVIRGNTKRKKRAGDEFVFDVASPMVMAVDDAKETENGSNNSNSKGILSFLGKKDPKGLVAELSFFGNYREPKLCVPLCPYLNKNVTSPIDDDDDDDESFEFVCRLKMDIPTKKWTVEQLSEDEVVAQSLTAAEYCLNENCHKKAKNVHSLGGDGGNDDAESKEDADKDETSSMDDLMDRIARVQSEFDSMKTGYSKVITDLGKMIQKDMRRQEERSAAIAAYRKQENEEEATGMNGSNDSDKENDEEAMNGSNQEATNAVESVDLLGDDDAAQDTGGDGDIPPPVAE